jgi:type IV pilus assembly protein PilC
VDNCVIGDAIRRARAAVREGESIAPPLRASGLFPALVVHMVGVGEATGSLDQMLAKVADFYEGEVDASLQSLTSALEPVMIVCLGAIVGFIVFSVFLPLLSIITEMMNGDGGGGGKEKM